MAKTRTVKVAKDASGGDLSNKAASAGRAKVAITSTTVDAQTPQQWRPEDTNLWPGDRAILTSDGSAVYYLETPEQPGLCYQTYRIGPYLEAVINALCVNVYGAGFKLKPTLDPTQPQARDKVRDALAYEKSNGDLDGDAEVSDEEVDAALKKYDRRMRNERIFLESFFKNCGSEFSYLEICVKSGQEKHIMGTSYWEVTRGIDGKPRKLMWAPAWSIKAVPLSNEILAVSQPEMKTVLKWDQGVTLRRFRKFIQVDDAGAVVAQYKEYGDPRIMSRNTGKYYATVGDLLAAEETVDNKGTVLPATEILHFAIPYPGSSVYGKPMWTASYPGLAGSRELSEHNRLVVTDQDVPQMMIFVAGARVNDADLARFEEQLNSRKPGSKGVHFFHAISQKNAYSTNSATPNFHVEKTKDAQHTDGLGLNYSAQVYNQFLAQYRIPKIALGDASDAEASTIPGMQRLVEGQVYDPERDMFDDRINTTLMPDLGIRCWQYKTLSREPKDPSERAKIISLLTEAGILTPDEGRELAEQIFNRPFEELAGAWSKLPSRLLTAVLQTKNQLVAAAVLGEEEGDLLSRLREAVLSELNQSGLRVQGVQSNGRQSNQQPTQSAEVPAGRGNPAASAGSDAIGSPEQMSLPNL